MDKLCLFKIISLFHQVFCTDANQFVLEVLTHRGMDPQISDVHVGIDGGQNMLKLGITITDKQDSTKTGRSLYSQVKKRKKKKKESFDVIILGCGA